MNFEGPEGHSSKGTDSEPPYFLHLGKVRDSKSRGVQGPNFGGVRGDGWG